MSISLNQPPVITNREYTGQLRFQERGNRRYLQQQVIENTITSMGHVTQRSSYFEDVPMVDEQEHPVDAKLREVRS
jgi:hypothetical protein